MNSCVLKATNISKAYEVRENKLSGIIWALKDIEFEIYPGERVAITGNNGAGKSTLLKIISRITAPTSGKIVGYGRIISMLEVGAGFHSELTGIQNIYLNGAMLGMKKAEIEREVDEIIQFAEIASHINNPVKRYSSGQYMRLAFSVAAHLKSEILIADEVLAVGDKIFREKCLKKMKELSSSEGRTIIMVSHNTDDLKLLCNKEIKLHDGRLT
ncbi:MAG: ABC transporter ATP-binding protein [Bacteroidota bacterium]